MGRQDQPTRAAMTPDEVGMLQRLVAGYWPSPAPSDDELAVWERALAPCDFETAVGVVDQISATGQHWRPTAGEFVAAYRLAASRLPRAAIDRSAPELTETTERLEEGETWPERIRRKLGASRGPLSHSFGSLVEGLQIDPHHPFPEHIHEKAMARAREINERS